MTVAEGMTGAAMTVGTGATIPVMINVIVITDATTDAMTDERTDRRGARDAAGLDV